jgi:hypothetical protein
MDLLDEQFQTLRERFPSAQLERRGDGTALITITGMKLPAGWSEPTVDVAFVVPLGYPIARPDTFWADADLRLASGGFPSNTQLNANYGGDKPRLWFSFHPTTWHPSRDTLLTFAKLIQHRLQEAQ